MELPEKITISQKFIMSNNMDILKEVGDAKRG